MLPPPQIRSLFVFELPREAVQRSHMPSRKWSGRRPGNEANRWVVSQPSQRLCKVDWLARLVLRRNGLMSEKNIFNLKGPIESHIWNLGPLGHGPVLSPLSIKQTHPLKFNAVYQSGHVRLNKRGRIL